ncbi:apolipoprotein N-acyltransferase [Aliiglaciecola sp. LCG003]|uniref:apolipoprotein N-acyltransferase n=1 Tax=Aliiglaciecola sp. LCG003 TaxID=3053655 RepID=UPI002573E263|nr:apolipoprotein N-acyltransferase [Aliiglaciecola sp. LCG003]WJG08024.1 apolipoprotein N-acyltransferase [Aliiglaciecola sp. LCG003]
MGALLTFSYAPFSIWPVMLACLSGFFYLLLISPSGFKSGFAFGLGWFGAGISWVHVSISEFGGLPLAGSIGLMLILCSYLALYPAIFASLLKHRVKPSYWLIAAPLLWVVVEWLRSWLLTGFPWLSIGYSQIDSPLAGWIAVIGESGLSALLIAICISISTGLRKHNIRAPAFLLVVSILGGWTLDQYDWVSVKAQPVSIAMVQGNIKQEMRWIPEQELSTMAKYQKMTQAHWSNDIIIWPEAAIPQLESTAEDYLVQLDEKALQTDTGLITGIVNYNYNTRQVFNNLIVLGKQSNTDKTEHYHYLHSNRYDKHHLLPIGEFIPFENVLRKLAPIFDLPMSSFTQGDFQQQNLLAKGYHLAPAICFEIAFPRQISANLTEQTDFIITVSNDAWFGASHGPDQHLEIAQVRAKEFGLPVLRATNNGITAFIDHKGHIQSRLPQFEAAVLSDDIFLTDGVTPYRMLGDLPLWILTLVGLPLVFWRQKRAK